MHTLKGLFLLLLFFLIAIRSTAQMFQYGDSSKVDSSKFIKILASDTFKRITQDSTGHLNILIGHVQLKQGNTLFYCDSAVQNIMTNTMEAFQNIHIKDGDSINVYSQYLKYYGNIKLADLKGKVTLTDGKATLTTESLQYDIHAKLGTYLNNGKLSNKKTILTSKEGYYYSDTKEVYFQQNVKVYDPEFSMLTDTLLYNINTEVAIFLAPTTIYDKKTTIRTKSGFYDMKNETGSFSNRPVIKDSVQTMIADKIQYDKKLGKGLAVGNILYRDHVNGMSVICGEAAFNNNTKMLKAYQFPLTIIRQDEEDLYIASDTLYSGLLHTDTSTHNRKDTLRFFCAYHHVKIYGDSLQGKTDSLYYSSADSVFRFFGTPVMWLKETQISGETMLLATKNKKVDSIFVFENAITVNPTKEGMFNQLRGNTITGVFFDGDINSLRAKGNSESLYYLQNDKDSAYMGLNYAMADAIEIKIEKREIKKITWVNAVNGNTYPMNKIPSDKKILKNFKWLDAERPKHFSALISTPINIKK